MWNVIGTTVAIAATGASVYVGLKVDIRLGIAMQAGVLAGAAIAVAVMARR